MRHWARLLAGGSPGARLVERDGVVAAVVPAAPERSVVNAVLYETADGLARAYDELATRYAEAGAAWTVWVPSADERAQTLLERAGHVIDGEPAAMALELGAGPERPPADALEDWTAQGDLAEVGPLNDRSYTFGTDSLTRALSGVRSDAIATYLARLDGRPVGCLMVVDHEGNADIEWVAVVPEARGRGIAGKLLAHALADAAERGVETSTLVATELGVPVYEQLGYRHAGTLQMWELRAARQ
jgi:GNAT superfamily N-acetyltransferase